MRRAGLLLLALVSAHAVSADFEDTVSSVLPTVVHIARPGAPAISDQSRGDKPGTSRIGASGVIIEPDGHILTLAHLFETSEPIRVRLNDGREVQAKLVGKDRRSDVALLKVEISGLSAARTADASKLRLGARVFAVGGLPEGVAVTDGIVSINQTGEEVSAGFIQTTAPLYPAMGGSPLFDAQGQLIGINVMIVVRSTGQATPMSFAIPINDALKVAAELRAHGRVRRGALGVVTQEVTKDLARAYGLPAPTGALVSSVSKDGSAARAGMVAGDVILRVGSQSIQSPQHLARVATSLSPGARVKVEVRRAKGASLERLEVTVADAGD